MGVMKDYKYLCNDEHDALDVVSITVAMDEQNNRLRRWTRHLWRGALVLLLMYGIAVFGLA